MYHDLGGILAFIFLGNNMTYKVPNDVAESVLWL
jgi:hypothetical protein